MKFELTKEYLSMLREAIREEDDVFILDQTKNLQAPDLAEIFDELDLDESRYLYTHIDQELAADILVEMDEDKREQFLSSFSSEQIGEFIENMDSDDAADVINELPEDVQEEVLSHIDDEELSSDIVDLLNYDEDTAGGLMAKEMIAVNINWTIFKCLKEMRRQAHEVEHVYTVYVTNDENKLEGLLSLKKMLLAPIDGKVENIFDKGVVSVTTDTSSEKVSKIMDKYNLVVLPVVDKLGRLVGRITIDDVVDVMREEADKDYQMQAGISSNVESNDKVWVVSKARLPWLLIALLGGIFGSRVIGMYEGVLQIHPEMAFFIPLIAAMGGNVGVQSSALVVQGIANQSLGSSDMVSRLIRELGVGLINGLICSVIILSYNLFFGDSVALSLTVSIALLSVIIFAAIFGTFVPLALHKYKVDPALATGPFITTTNDILGALIYFSIGRLMYTLV
ncbi:MAG: magnesium transporter [Bacteroidota bacterium]